MKRYILVLCLTVLFPVVSIYAGVQPDSLLKALQFAKNDSVRIDKLYEISDYYLEWYPAKAIKYADEALNIVRENGYRNREPELYILLGKIYFQLGEYNKTLEYYFSSSEINKEIANHEKFAADLCRIANVYRLLKNAEHAVSFYQKSGVQYIISGKYDSVPQNYLGIASIYQEAGIRDSSLLYINRTMQLINQIQDQKVISGIYHRAGSILVKLEEYEDAVRNFEMAGKINAAIDDKEGLIDNYIHIGNCFLDTDKPDEAREYYFKARDPALNIRAWSQLMWIYKSLSKIYEMQHASDKAFKAFEIYSAYSDSIQEEETRNRIKVLKKRFEIERTDNNAELLNRENQLTNLIIAEENEHTGRHAVLIYGILIIIFICSLLLLLIIIRIRHKKRVDIHLKQQQNEIFQQKKIIQNQKEEIIAQVDEIEEKKHTSTAQKDLIDLQTKEITDSLKYAYRIHKIVTTTDIYLRQIFPMSFVFSKPKDLVSGDFYWVEKKGEQNILIVANCQGHGVPGAFISMLGTSILYEVVSDKRDITASGLLDDFNHLFRESFKMEGTKSKQTAVIDLTVCVVNKRERSMQYAGAKNSVYIVTRDKHPELSEFLILQSENKQVGVYKLNNDSLQPDVVKGEAGNGFKNHTLSLKHNDEVFIFSDGFVNQKGGSGGEKYTHGNFMRLLIEAYGLEKEQQGLMFENVFNDWLEKNGKRYAQEDDVLVIGFRV